MTASKALFVPSQDQLLQNYTPEEIVEIQEVFEGLFKDKKPSGQKLFVGTAGVPGAGKSRFAREYAKTNPFAILVDVNDNCLAALPGYRRDLETVGFDGAYEKWRDASNWISINANQRALAEGYDLIAVGTAASPFAIKLFVQARKSGYSVQIFAFSAPVDVCLGRNEPENRMSDVPPVDRVAFHIPPHHITEKRQPFFDNMRGIVAESEHYSQYWNPSNEAEPKLAFTISCAVNPKKRTLSIVDGEATLAFLKDSGLYVEGASLNSMIKWHLGILTGKQRPRSAPTPQP